LQVIVAAHPLVSFAFLHSDEFSCFKVAVERSFFNELLIKDVDGLYEFDPNADGASQPRRYRSIHWQDALRLKAAVVQHKAIHYAARQEQSFEVAAPGGNDGTNVGDFETKFYGR
jgi:uridylate kinase